MMAGSRRCRLVALAFVASAACLPVATIHAQGSAESKLKNNKEELARIRREREELQQHMQELQNKAHTLEDEVHNLDRQHDATKRAVSSLGHQLDYINDAVKQTTAALVRAEDEAEAKHAMLKHRLIEIYKRGPLYDFEALLSAHTFGELVARYKYLHELALRDRALVHRVDELRTTVRNKRGNLVTLQGDLRENQYQKQQEEQRLRIMEQQQQRNLARVQEDAKKAQAKLKQLARAESRVNSLIASIESERRRGSSRSSAIARGSSSIRTSDYGKLAWPVDGNILYRFGRVVNPNNTTIRWNGIGIAAAPGTPVKCVAGGQVVAAAQVGTYGETVIVEHGGGDYSVYSSLGHANVSKGDKVSKGQVVGTVGVSDPDLPPHLHFEIRHEGAAVDPATWLRNQ